MFYNALSLTRPIFSYAKVQTWLTPWIRNRRFQLSRKRLMTCRYLNIGCGLNTHHHFINCDYLWHPKVDLCWDICAGLPFANESMEGIYTEHCLEHLSLAQVQTIFAEAKRILKPNGILRIIVPDVEMYLRTYVRQIDGDASTRFPYQKAEETNPTWTPLQSVNRIFYQDRESAFGHQIMYDKQLLDRLLRLSGFNNVTCEKFGKGKDPLLLVDTADRAVESLYLEASFSTA